MQDKVEDIAEMCNRVLDGQFGEIIEPSLPDNLDEAAEEYAPDFSNSIASKAAVDAVRDAFKAGGKWMAEQGYTTETRVDRTPMNGPIGICLHLHDSTGFKIDDKVIVQVRKKQ